MTVGVTARTIGEFIPGVRFAFMQASSMRRLAHRALVAAVSAAIGASAVVIGPVARVVPASTAAAGSFTDPHFTETTIWSGLTQPTSVRFASDGRAFVTEKRGIIKAFDSVNDSSPTTVLDIRKDVHDFWDRGLLSIALDPDFLDGSPFIYIYYVYDAPPGGTAPTWPSGQSAPTWSNSCPSPPGSTLDGCVVTSKLDRYTVNLNTNVADTASRKNLIGDGGDGEWCQQFPSHAGGALAFGPDGQLYVSGGDGASFTGMDWGQRGGSAGSPTPVNPCDDPFTGNSTTSEGGMLRSQDIRTMGAGDPLGLDGSIIRINPNNGNPSSGNPLEGNANENAERMVAHGFRNPYRMTFRPGHSDLYVGDVGNSTWEEIDRVTVPGSATTTTLPNFGWPCYEGVGRQSAFESLDTNLCQNLYAQSGAATAPLYTYTHVGSLTPKGPCFPGSGDQTSSITGLAFYQGASGNAVPYPAKYDGALFFVDYSRNCLGAVLPQGNGIPDPTKVEQIASDIGHPVDLTRGPGGDLFYVNHEGGEVSRIKYVNSPIAKATATPAHSIAPVTVHLDGSTSSEPNAGFTLDGWDWDFFNDGSFDASGEEVDWQIDTPGEYQVKLRVHSTSGLTDSFTLNVDANNNPPEPVIDSPASCGAPGCWQVGDTIHFTGHATDAEDGNLTGGDLSWRVVMRHCPAGCHEHTIETDGGGSGSVVAPDHEYPSHLVLRLTATDSEGASSTVEVELEPKTVTIGMASVPGVVSLSVGNETHPAPWTATAIKAGIQTISGPLTRQLSGERYRFSTWNDSHKRVRDLKVNGNRQLTATYVPDRPDSCSRVDERSAKGTAILERSSGNGDADWFEFHLKRGRDVRIRLDDLHVRGRLDLYKSCSNLLATSNKSGKQAESLKRTLGKGTYRIRVTSPNDGWSSSPYSLRIKPLD
jgi:glucose/arabinose dehydrogenase